MKRTEFLIWTWLVFVGAITWTFAAMWFTASMWWYTYWPNTPHPHRMSLWARLTVITFGDVLVYTSCIALALGCWYNAAYKVHREYLDERRQREIEDLEHELEIGSHES